eukprot:g73308.t1
MTANPKDQQVIQWDEGWKKIKSDGIEKVQLIIEKGEGTFTHQDYVTLYTIIYKMCIHSRHYMYTDYVTLYTIIYKMCIQKAPFSFSKELYESFDRSFTQYLRDVTLPAINKKNGAEKIQELVQRWKNHKLMRKWMCAFFCYLDRFYIKRHSMEPLQRVATTRFCSLVYDEVKSKVTEVLLELIAKDRNMEEVDRDLVRDCIQIYVEMGLGRTVRYTEDFQAPFIQATAAYFSKEAAEWLAHDSCPEYLRKAEERFEQEKARLRDFLHPSSQEPLMNVLHQTILIAHQKEILGKPNTGVKALLARHSKDDLSRMFSLYQNVPSSLDPIADIVKEYITEIGLSLIKKAEEEKKAQEFVVDLMKLHDRYYDLVVTSFQAHAVFHKALKTAFETIVNEKVMGQSSALLLSSYADQCLRKGGIKQSTEELEATLENIVRLFAYLIDKDMFSEFYRKQLSKRLLLQRSASTDAEKSMIGKLKIRCGAQFTSKLEGMINDMRQAQEEQRDFQKFLTDRQVSLGYEFTAQTLTTGFWPTQLTAEVKLPKPLQRGLTTFKLYYDQKTSNRKLRWLHPLGIVTLSRQFRAGRRDLIVSTVQASILMFFNEKEQATIEEMTTVLGLEPDIIKAQLRSLVSGQFKVLRKKPAEGYNPKHIMSVNPGFTHQMRVIRIPNAVHKTSKKEQEASEGAVEEDRKHSIEANIVRVMKSRKTLTHQQLMSEVSQQLMQFFKPDPRQIKKRIEDLIQREYLERDAEKSYVYHYLA